MLSCCRRVGLLDHEQYLHASHFETKNGGRVLPPAGRYLSEEQVDALLGACVSGGASGAATRIRDYALLTLLASAGIRSIEVTGLDVSSLVPGEGRIDLTITKGGRPREAWLHPSALKAIEAWLQVRGQEPGALFTPLSRTGRPLVHHGPLSYHQVWRILRQRAEQARLGVVTPHDLRRFFITTLLEKGYDLVLVCRIAGHVRPETTAGYDRRPAAAQRDAIESLSLGAFKQKGSDSQD